MLPPDAIQCVIDFIPEKKKTLRNWGRIARLFFIKKRSQYASILGLGWRQYEYQVICKIRNRMCEISAIKIQTFWRNIILLRRPQHEMNR